MLTATALSILAVIGVAFGTVYQVRKGSGLPVLPAAPTPDVPMGPSASASTSAAIVASVDPSDPLRYAFEECGLPVHKLRPDFDVAATGKLHEVIHHASQKMGKAHPIRTVSDIQAILQR